MPKLLNRALRIAPEIYKVNATVINVIQLDESNNVIFAKGLTVPPNGDAGYAVGAEFIKTNGVAGATLYVNEGTTSSCAFHLESNSAPVQSKETTVATTSNTDVYIIAPVTGNLASLIFSGHDALTANDTNYITFSATNLGQAGAGSNAMLAATAVNTTQATGGTGLAADTLRTLTLSATAANLAVTKGDRIRVRMAATGTLANTVTLASVLATFN